MTTTRIGTLLIATALLLAPLRGVAHAEPLLTGLGGPAGYGVNNLPANDDGSTDLLDITGAFPSGLRFFGNTFTALYLNNNGNVTFGGPLYTYTPMPFPIASQPMIAPFWGDVDTRADGFFPPNHNAVYWDIRPGQFVATWHNVGYYGAHSDRENDFQLILTAAGPGVGDFDVEFRYNRCEWTTGDASGGSGGFGGTPAQAGFDAGNLTDYTALPGSFTMEVLNLCRTSNVGIPGVWRFAIRNGVIDCPGFGTPCDTGLVGVCAAGTNRCRSATEVMCVQNTMPGDDVCNGLDDDCDSRTDESQPSLMCGVGACAVTQPSCVGGNTVACVPGTPSPEICNLVDDDCNGIEDDAPELTCGIGTCRVALAACVGGGMQVCTPGVGHPEICNGLDDDCDGVNDNGLMGCVHDADLFGDAGTDGGGRDAGRDGAVLVDGSVVQDAAAVDARICIRHSCDPFIIQGRSGPGCDCGIAGGRGHDRGALALIALGLLLVARRRVTRR